MIWSEYGEVPKAQVLLRAHVHSFNFCGGTGWAAFTTPALQGWGSKFGERRCDGTVDFGFLAFEIANKEDYTWKAYVHRELRAVSVSKV